MTPNLIYGDQGESTRQKDEYDESGDKKNAHHGLSLGYHGTVRCRILSWAFTPMKALWKLA